MNILVLCTDNSARSILLEAILNHRSGGRIKAWSAGSKPAGKVHPQSLKLMAEKGFPTDGLTSQSWDDFAKPDAPVMDAVITVADRLPARNAPIGPVHHCAPIGALKIPQQPHLLINLPPLQKPTACWQQRQKDFWPCHLNK